MRLIRPSRPGSAGPSSRAARAFGLALGAWLCVGCTPPPETSRLKHGQASSDVRTVLVDGGDTVGSVLPEGETRAVLAVIQDETRAVQELLALEPSVRPRLIALTAPDDPQHVSLNPSRDGVHGRASEDGLVIVVPLSGGLIPDALRPVIRHEVLHVESFRAGLRGPVWWNEGLACEVEAMESTGDRTGDRTGGALELERFPMELGFVKRRVDRVTDAALISERKADLTELGPELAGYEYPVYRSFVRYLLECELKRGLRGVAQAEQSFAGTASRALEEAQRDLTGSLAGWRQWLAELDVLAMIARAAHSESAADRVAAMIALADLATDGLPEVRTTAADDLAIELLADEAAYRGALAFLLFTRARTLDASRVDRVCADPDPWVRLAGLAVRRTRGEPVSDEELHAAWASAEGDRRFAEQLLELRLPRPAR